ncbi:hypothetical protein ABMA58_12510, partial [Oceanospirillum sp. HFRX-1_2]
EILTFSELSQCFDERMSQKAEQERQAESSDGTASETTYSEGEGTETTSRDEKRQVVSADDLPPIPDSE